MNKLFSLLLLLLTIPSLASSKVIVTAEKISLDKEKTNSIVDVISESEIINSGESSLTDLIQKKSSLHINSNGAFGKATSLFLRGADSSYTLIVIDGVEYNDKSSVGGAAILEHIDLSSVEKIEILKGSQSVLYGSDALAGVIKITTKSPGKNIGSNGSIGYGSYDNKMASFSTSQKGEFFDYSMGLSLQDVEGISSYNSLRAPMAEKDGLSNLTANFKGQKKISKKDSVEFNLRGVRAESDFDSSTEDKLNYMGRDSQLIAGLKYKRIMGEYWVPELSFNFNKSDRLTNSFSLSRLVAKTKKAELFNSFFINENITLINGVEFEETKASIERIDNKKNFNSLAAYIGSHFVYDKASLQLGGRWTKESNLADQLTWKAGMSVYILDNTTFKMNASTGFKSPSLYQLFSTYGNDKLLPTKSRSFDFGIVQKLYNSEISLTVFKDSYENVIDFESTLNKYTNTFKAESKGVEIGWSADFNLITIDASTTLLRAINKSSGSEGTYLARRPREKYFVGLTHQLNEVLTSSLNYTYVGQRENSDFDSIVLSSYSLVDLDFKYDFSKGHNLILKLGNVLDKEYEEVYGFGTLGRNYLLKYNFRM